MNGCVSVIGSLNYDIIIQQKRLPLLGETYTADHICFSGGGKGANQAVQCAKLGLPTVMAGKIGRDPFGDMLLKQMKGWGVDCTYIGSSSRPTGMGVVHALEDGGVYASVCPGANFDITKEETERLDQMIKNSQILILQLEIPTDTVESLIRKANRYGVYTILNAAPSKEIHRSILKMADCLIVNETEAAFYIGANQPDLKPSEQEQRLRSLTDKTIILTLGAKGSLLFENEGTVFIDPVKAEPVVDTTGAGDSYVGAFAYGKYKKMADRDACRFASKVSAVTVTKLGAQEAMPDLKDMLIEIE